MMLLSPEVVVGGDVFGWDERNHLRIGCMVQSRGIVHRLGRSRDVSVVVSFTDSNGPETYQSRIGQYAK